MDGRQSEAEQKAIRIGRSLNCKSATFLQMRCLNDISLVSSDFRRGCRGHEGMLSSIEIDTAHFKGNFPESCEVHAVSSPDIVPDARTDADWTLILPRTKLGPHRQHQFQLENVDQPYTHIKVTIYPDGGIKRVRVIGRRAHEARTGASAAEARPALTTANASATVTASIDAPQGHHSEVHGHATAGGVAVIPALTLTAEACAPFGQVVQAYADVNAVPSPRNTRITGANQGTAVKFHKLALLESSYPPESNATTGLSVYRCKPIDVPADRLWEVKLLERHPATKQAFISMGEAFGENALSNPGKRYLVIVALNGEDDKPDLSTMRAFIASAGQGIMYNTGIWRKCLSLPSEDTAALTQQFKYQTILWPFWTVLVVSNLRRIAETMLTKCIALHSQWTSPVPRHRSVTVTRWTVRS